MATGPLTLMIMVGFTIYALILILTELVSPFAKLFWLAALVAGIYFAPVGAHAIAPIATCLVLGAKLMLDKARGSAV